jgi:serine/threonine protein kinase
MASVVIDNRYVVQQRLNGGAQGEVYKVFDTHMQAVEVLKLLNRPMGGHWAEARILSALRDDHILEIRNADVDQSSGRAYIVTELAPHGTLEKELAKTQGLSLDVDDVVRWMKHVALGVARAHDARLLHNDLKPGNLFLNAERECLVGDFGFATLIPTRTGSAVIPGATAATASPEVASTWQTGRPEATRASDIYSVGATAYWLLAGRPPHDLSGVPDATARMAIVAAIEPERLRDAAPHVPLYIAHVVEKAMARAEGDRYQNVTEINDALGSVPRVSRRWRPTNEHPGHLGCWRGEPVGGGSTYVLCLEPGDRPTRCVVTARHAGSGNRIHAARRTAPMRERARAVRSAMRFLS